MRSIDGEVQPQRLQPTSFVMLPSAHSVVIGFSRLRNREGTDYIRFIHLKGSNSL